MPPVRTPLPWESLALGLTVSLDGPDGHVAIAEVVGIGSNWLTISLPDGSPARTIQRNQIREQTLRKVAHP